MAIDQQKMLESRQHLEEKKEEEKGKEEDREEEGKEEGEHDEILKSDTNHLTKSNGRRGRGRRSRKKRGKKGRRASKSISIIATTADVELTSWLKNIMTDVTEDIEADQIVVEMLAELDAYRSTPSRQ